MNDEPRAATPPIDYEKFRLSLNSPWRKSPLHSPGVASRLTSAFVG